MKYGRKFWLAVATLASANAMLTFGYIEGGVWSGVVICLIGAYFTANVSQKAVIK